MSSLAKRALIPALVLSLLGVSTAPAHMVVCRGVCAQSPVPASDSGVKIQVYGGHYCCGGSLSCCGPGGERRLVMTGCIHSSVSRSAQRVSASVPQIDPPIARHAFRGKQIRDAALRLQSTTPLYLQHLSLLC